MAKKIYISGRITGVKNYKKIFERASDHLISMGYKVVNPACMDDVMPNASYEDYMKVDMYLLDDCDSVYMLKGWEQSVGAIRELGFALGKGKEIIFEN